MVDFETLARRRGTTLVLGNGESRKDAWWAALADELVQRGVDFEVLSADPALPVCGPPGAVTLARRLDGRWATGGLEALCTLDAARFRLPLVVAAARLRRRSSSPLVLVDAPAVRRGMAAGELVSAFLDQLGVDAVVLLGARPPEIAGFSVDVFEASAPTERLSPAERRARRSAQWNAHLAEASERELPSLPLLGAPPPPDATEAWLGRQVAALDGSGATLAFGECRGFDGRSMRVRVDAPPFCVEEARALLVRDGRRDESGALGTAPRDEAARPAVRVSDLDGGGPDPSERPRVTSLVTAKALLVNGVFGDPLLHLRLRHRKRSFLFDLGDAARLPARIVHQVSDVFVTHAHFDHVGGFLWFLRSCIGSPHERRVFGPPGIADHLAGMIAGIRWDRVGDRGPVFEVAEVFSDRLERHRLRAGDPPRERLEDRAVHDGVLHEEPGLEVRALELDHGIPVLAFAFAERRVLHIRKERLSQSGLEPGPWLSELKRSVLDDALDTLVALPGGERRPARDLAEELVLSKPGKKLVYATDLDDSDANREALARFARGASFFYCEASFLEEDAHLARKTQHLTTRATAEIAEAAEVDRLVPFHFSKRYESEPEAVYAQIESHFGGRVVRLASRGHEGRDGRG